MTTPNDGRPVEGGRGDKFAAPTGPPTPDGHVFEAEILTDAENEEVARRFGKTTEVERRQPAHLARRHSELARRAVLAVHQRMGAAWRSEQVLRARSVLGYRARKVPVDVVRLIWFALRGNWRWIQKAWTYLTYGDLRADVRAARLAGDAEARRKAQEMIRADSRARWAKLGIALERGWKGVGAAGATGLGLWLVDSMMSRNEMWPWLAGLYRAIETIWSLVTASCPSWPRSRRSAG